MSVYVEAWGLLSVPATLREALTLPGDRRGLGVRALLKTRNATLASQSAEQPNSLAQHWARTLARTGGGTGVP